ncbi:MAG: hypothetical protein FWH06_01205, partial [Oscillospiraceae bacterium]|nr:hypothetical protein [Oscillospiraceae bacterium]
MNAAYRRERLKTILIAFLLVTLVALTALNFLYDREDIAGSLARRIPWAGVAEPPPDAAREIQAVLPAAVAVRRGGVLTGAAFDAAVTDTLYGLYSTLLGMALASARDAQPLPESGWTAALDCDGVFIAFYDPIPSWL